MEHAEPLSNQDKVTQTDTQLSSKTLFGMTLVIYAIVEFEFLQMLWDLIGKHATYHYLLNGMAFQLCFIVSAISLWRCLRLAQTGEEAMRNFRKISSQMTIVVVMLLLSLMQFSTVTQAYIRIRQ